MLNIADTFATKWKMKFNKKKSKIMIIGKHVSERKWPIGNIELSETRSYKYLGVHINRTLQDNDHLKEVCKKGSKIESHLRFTLASHLDMKRAMFGSEIWNKMGLPAITHACAVWLNRTDTSKRQIKSIQYKSAKQCSNSNVTLLTLPY